MKSHIQPLDTRLSSLNHNELRVIRLSGSLRDFLRPAKHLLMDFLVASKKFSLHSIFRLRRFISVSWLFSTNSLPERITPNWNRKHRIKNGMSPRLGLFSLVVFALFRSQKLHIVLFNGQSEESQTWYRATRNILQSTISFAGGSNLDESWMDSRRRILTKPFLSDVLLLDASHQLPSAIQILELMHSLRKLNPLVPLGAVHPAYIENNGSEKTTFAGFNYNSSTQKWEKARNDTIYFQGNIPRLSFNVLPHGLLLSNEVVRKVPPADSLKDGGWENELAEYVKKSWKTGFATICYPQVSLEFSGKIEPVSSSSLNRWFERSISDPSTALKIIFVLPATSLSGGIRVVFEIAQSLLRLGHDVEIWSLFSHSEWESNELTIRYFAKYQGMIEALSAENAIKVATWWETAQIVLLSSIRIGKPVQFVQEFETWFYPDDAVAQAAVVSSYRPEFTYLTIAEYQQSELAEIGITSSLIPVGYDSNIYKQIEGHSSPRAGMLAVGRSFFQKNFKMTVEAWKSLGEDRPNLVLFGHEPEILNDQKSKYMRKPSNSEVNSLYNNALFFVQTSRHEGFCLPIIEAMAAGCPVITTDSHGNRGFCFDEVNCLVVEQDDVHGLAQAIRRLSGDTDLQEKLRREGLKTAQKYSWEVLYKQYSNFFDTL